MLTFSASSVTKYHCQVPVENEMAKKNINIYDCGEVALLYEIKKTCFKRHEKRC